MNRTAYLFVGLGLMVLAACKTDPQTQNTADFKRTSDTVVIRQEVEPDRMNPLLTTRAYSRAVFDNLGLYLEYFDGNTLTYQPQLLVRAPRRTTITEGPYAGGLALDMVIHPEAVWDDGSPVTGHDVAFTFKAAINPLIEGAIAYRTAFNIIKEVSVDEDDPKKFRVVAYPQTIIAQEIITNATTILPRYAYDPEGYLDDYTIQDLAELDPESAADEAPLVAFADYFNAPETSSDPERITGCGPYELIEWAQGERLVLRKKDNWWGDALTDSHPQLEARPEALVFVPINSPATAIQALRSEEIDVTRAIPPNEYVDLLEDEYVTARYNLYAEPSMTYYFISVNATDPLLSEKAVRQAIAHTVNVQEIIDNIYAGMGTRIASPVYKDLPYYNEDLEPIPFNIDRARTLLAEAGWEDTNDNGIVDKVINGERQELSIQYNFTASSETSQNIALLLQDNARQAGIDIQPNGVEGREGIMKMITRDYQMASAGSTYTGVWHPRQSWHTEGDNRTGFGNAETDAMIDEITETLDTTKRYEMYRELQEIIYDEMVNIYLFMRQEPMAVHKRFEMDPTIVFPGYIPRTFALKEDLQE